MIKSATIENAVYKLCVEANTVLSDDVFEKILEASKNETNRDAKQALELILKNAKASFETKKPLCQDTGLVLVFVKVGQNANPESLSQAINSGVEKAYEENFYRKSVVKNALFDRTNTKNNLPLIIYPEFVDGNSIEIEILIKGGGAENMSAVTMFSPTSSEEEIVDYVVRTVKKGGSNPCPPIFIGVGIGGTMEYAGLLSKKALLLEENIDENHKNLAERIKQAVNNLEIGAAGLGGNSTALDVKVLSGFTHIASLPVAVTINCHSSRHAKCKIEGENISFFEQNKVKNYVPQEDSFNDYIKVEASDILKLKSLKEGDKVLLSGEIFTARDAAHKRLVEMVEKGEELPIELKDKIIFYAGPCPCPENQVIGSVGPTTSSRMDKYAPILYKMGVIATIGKGERSEDVQKTVKHVGGLYFTVFGGVACILSEKVFQKELIAFEDLGTEAIYRLVVRDFPLRVQNK